MSRAPIIDLQRGTVENPQLLYLAVIAAMMFWPDDELARKRWVRAAMLEKGREHLDEMPQAVWAHYTRDALDAPRLEALQPDAARRFRYGLYAGTIVLNATTYAAIAPERSSLRQVQEELCKVVGVQPRSLNNKASPVRRLRPVAHLWAAYIHACHLGDRTFPCPVDSLPAFLGTAVAIRRIAETTRAKKAPAPVMQPGHAARLPDDVLAALPEMSIQIS